MKCHVMLTFNVLYGKHVKNLRDLHFFCVELALELASLPAYAASLFNK